MRDRRSIHGRIVAGPSALWLLPAVVVAGCGDGAPARSPAPAPRIPPPAVPTEEAPAEPDSGTGAPVAAAADAAPPAPRAAAEPGLPMMLEFTRDHCLPCEIMAPWVAELREKHAGRVLIREINIDRPENRELGVFFKARSIPVQVYVDAEGREVGRHVGLATKAQMERTLRRHGFGGER